MKKLNFGCGDRIAPGWENIDFSPMAEGVKQVNLLAGFPYQDATFDVAYSSHVLEHLQRADGHYILHECKRILRSNGIVRIVVPDLEASCREYLRILDDTPHSEVARQQYEWIILEMLDQMVRAKPSGEMQAFFKHLSESGDKELSAYVTSRTQNTPLLADPPRSFRKKLAALNIEKLKSKIPVLYVKTLMKLIPGHLRRLMIDQTPPGEKHRWMYDRYSLGQLLRHVGFTDIQFLTANESAIPGFQADGLDTLPDGRPYKNISIYAEARKP